MKVKFLKLVLALLSCLLLTTSVSGFASESEIIGEDGKPVAPGEEITKGIGIIDEISFEKGYVIIEDTKYLFDEELVLINKGKKYASQSIFTEGTRVVWTVKGEETALVLDHYPFDESEIVADGEEDADSNDTQPDDPGSDQGSDDITLGDDGVYRN